MLSLVIRYLYDQVFLFQNAKLKDELNDKDKRMKQLEDRLTMSIQEKARSDEKLELLLEELQNIDLTSSSRMLRGPDKPSPSKKKALPKSSPFSFLTNSYNPHSSGRTQLSLRKSAKNNKRNGAQASVSNTDVQTNGNAHAQSETCNSDKGTNGSVDEDQDDENGSKACSVM